MTEPKQITWQEYVTPKTEQEIIAKAMKSTQNRTPCKKRKQERIDHMLRLIFHGKTDFTEIAQEIGVSRSQAYKYWGEWSKTEEASQVNVEWWAEYKRLKEAKSPKAFDGLTRIKYRLTTEKLNVKSEHTETHIDITAQVDELVKISRVEICSTPNNESQPSATN
jgi:transposase-like protein